MRTIKFRGMRVDGDKGWVYGYYCPTCFGRFPLKPAIVIADDEKWEPVEVHPSTVGQFTGLKDRTGKEIFEGDVVEIRYIWYGGTKKEKKADSTKIKEIIWNDLNCCFGMYAEEDYDYQMINSQSMEIEIIGSVHEDAGLVEKGEK